MSDVTAIEQLVSKYKSLKSEIAKVIIGQDEVVNTEYARFFYIMLPRDIPRQYINYPRAHHYIFYEDNRDEIFEDILQFLSENI